MAGVNKAILLGRLGRDPEMSFTPGGLAVCKFSIATSRKDKNGNETTQWHRCTAFGKAGELISQYVSKGRELYVEGEIQYGQYEKDGITRYTTDIIVRDFNFIGGGGQQQGGYQGNQQGGGFQGGGQQGSYGGQQGGGYQGGQQGGYGGGQQNSYQNSVPQDNFQGGAPGGQTTPDDDIPF